MHIIRRLRSALSIPALALLPLAGCFDTANPSELSCTQGKYCPDGYVCVGAQTGSPGKCQKPADAGISDAISVTDGADSLDGRANTDSPVPPNDGPTTNIDMLAAIDQSPSPDISNEPDTASDLPESNDLGRDAFLDGPIASPDAPADSPTLQPDMGPPDQNPQGPDVAPDLPYGPEIGPDVAPTSCVIGGTTYASGAANPGNSCQICKPTTSPSGWSNADEGTSCNGGQYCNLGACKTGCFISGAYYANGAANPANPCQTCQTTYALTSWVTSANGTSCGTGQVCAGGACQSGCWIEGAFVSSGNTSTSNVCQICQPTASTSGWSNNVDGTSCSSGGQTCAKGSCACTKGAPACGGCLAWDFEWGTNPAPWSLEMTPGTTSPNGATNIGITQSRTHGGSYALSVPIGIDLLNTNIAEVTVSLPCKVNLSGYTGAAYVYFASSYPLTDWTNQLIVDTWSSSGTGPQDHSVPFFGNMPINEWFKVPLGFAGTDVDRIGITLTPSTNWVGTLYIDDVVINGL